MRYMVQIILQMCQNGVVFVNFNSLLVFAKDIYVDEIGTLVCHQVMATNPTKLSA